MVGGVDRRRLRCHAVVVQCLQQFVAALGDPRDGQVDVVDEVPAAARFVDREDRIGAVVQPNIGRASGPFQECRSTFVEARDLDLHRLGHHGPMVRRRLTSFWPSPSRLALTKGRRTRAEGRGGCSVRGRSGARPEPVAQA